MKKILLISLIMLFVIPAFCQKLSKEEKAAIAKAAYEKALTSIQSRSFVLVPSQYTDRDGAIQPNTDNSEFFSVEGKDIFIQGRIVCNNNYTNIAEATEYDCTVDKKGNIKLRIIVLGRQIKGTYNFNLRANSNVANVIYTPPTGGTKKFSGEIVPLAEASYNKRSNPM